MTCDDDPDCLCGWIYVDPRCPVHDIETPSDEDREEAA